jgi:hypothetical protein
MAVIIDEFVADVQPEPTPNHPDDAAPPSAAPSGAEALIELLALSREREARLAID